MSRFYLASQVLNELHRILCFGAIGPNVVANFERRLPLT
jgi:hypothetical protein